MLAIIAARAGSKGLKDKNILNLCGKPVIGHTIEHALKSKLISKVIVTTDSQRIADISRSYGAEVPFLRPKRLAQDNSSILKSFEHTLKHLEKKNLKYKNFVSLGACSPIRDTNDIDNAIKLFFKKKALTLISVKKNDKPIDWLFKSTKGNRLTKLKKKPIMNRQKHEKLFIPNGSIFIFNVKKIIQNIKLKKDYSNSKTFYYLMPQERSIDIDSKFDFNLASYLLKKKKLKNRV